MKKKLAKKDRPKVYEISNMRFVALRYILDKIYSLKEEKNFLVNDARHILKHFEEPLEQRKKRLEINIDKLESEIEIIQGRMNGSLSKEEEDDQKRILDFDQTLLEQCKVGLKDLEEKRFTEDGMRKALKNYEKDKLIVKGGASLQHNRKRYYPNETNEGFRSLVNMMAEYKERDKFGRDYTAILYSAFSRLFVNRQLILDVLKERNVKLALRGDGKNIEFPLAGRYRKMYETHMGGDGPLSSMIDSIDVFREEIANDIREWGTEKDKTDSNEIDGELHVLIEEKLQNIDAFLEAIRELISDEIEKCREFKKIVEEKGNGSLENTDVWDRFKHDPTGLYRKESTWSPIYLTDEEKVQIGNIECKGHKLTDEEYRSMMEEKVIIPILCLIQSSPSALIYFVTGDWEDLYKEPNEDHTLLPLSGGGNLFKLLWNLVRKTIEDIIKDHSWGFGTNVTGFPSYFVYWGNMKKGNEPIPSLITFRLDDGRHVVYYGGEGDGYRIPFELQGFPVDDISTVCGNIQVSIFEGSEKFKDYLESITFQFSLPDEPSKEHTVHITPTLRRLSNNANDIRRLMKECRMVKNDEGKKRIKERINQIELGRR